MSEEQETADVLLFRPQQERQLPQGTSPQEDLVRDRLRGNLL